MYTSLEAAGRIGVSKNSLLRWIAEGLVPDVGRDWRGWRIWSDNDVAKLRAFKSAYHARPIPRTRRRRPDRPEYTEAFAKGMMLLADACAKRMRRQR